ncbi:MAG: hypothetical protein EOP04_08460, partial [Proteobacteria bacterium]
MGQDLKDDIILHSGNELSVEESVRLTSSRRCKLIVFAGPARCGKTTLIASLFEMFGKNSYKNFIFSGSETLIGFEKRCHLARVTSGEPRPDTERTAMKDGERLLHLTVRGRHEEDSTTDLLFSDLSGEFFKLAREHEDEAK